MKKHKMVVVIGAGNNIMITVCLPQINTQITSLYNCVLGYGLVCVMETNQAILLH